MSYMQNLPHEVQAKVELLSEYKSHISRLDSELQAMRTKYEKLQEELIRYRIDAKNPAKRSSIMVASSINTLPNELLLEIFESFLATDHRFVYHLLRTCRGWHRIIMQSPKLWARIQLVPNYDTWHYQHISTTKYVEACLSRSQSMLLDVELDYSNFRPFEEYVLQQVCDSVSDLVDDSDDNDMLNWVDCLQCNLPSPKYDRYFDDAMGALDTLVGPLGAYMQRWENLNLCFPQREAYLALDIWRKFTGSTPNLQTFSLPDKWIIDPREWDDDDGVIGNAFPGAPGLRSLTLGDSTSHHLLQHLPTLSSTLLHLDIHFDIHNHLTYEKFLIELSRVQTLAALRELTLRVGRGSGERLRPPRSAIRLPNLQNLTLFGSSYLLRKIEFELPCLRELLVFSQDNIHLPPNISPRNLHWSIIRPMDKFWTPGTIGSALKKVLRSYSGVQVITIGEVAQVYLVKVIARLRQSLTLPASLETVVVNRTNGGKDIVHISTLS